MADANTTLVIRTALRHQFVDDLVNNILKCSICCEELSGNIWQCDLGHHFCQNCRMKLNRCPNCRYPFYYTRNYLAEEIIAKFSEMKISMASISTQTDFETETNAIIETIDEVPKMLAADVAKGRYLCKIKNCGQSFSRSRLLIHLREHHKKKLLEEETTVTYKNSWIIACCNPSFERAICIPNMGLFFLIVSIDDCNNLHGNLQIVNKATIAQKFNYSLDIGIIINKEQSTKSFKSFTYNGDVLPARLGRVKNVSELFIRGVELPDLFKTDKSTSFIYSLMLNRKI